MTNFRNDKSAAYNAAHVADYNTGLSSELTLRNQPLNEILSLAGLSGVSAPNLTSTPQTSVSPTGIAGVNIAGLTEDNYKQQLDAYNQGQANLGGLFGTLGNVASAALPFVLG